MENKRLKQALDNLKILEKNCSESKKGFKPNVVVCMYLVESLLEIVGVYPVKVLRKFTVTTSFNDKDELISYLDTTIGRMKRVEHYVISTSELVTADVKLNKTAFEFLIKSNYEPQGQLEKFLSDLLKRLNEVFVIMTDPRRSQAKISYLDRMFAGPLIQIASVLEALSIGVANV